MEHRIFELGDFALQKGSVLPDAKLGYLTLGELNAAKDNAVLCPTWFTGHALGHGAVDDRRATARSTRAKYFIVIPNHFGAAVSSSPSNTPPPFEKGRFPRATTYDNIAAQHRLVTEELGIERLRLVSSWSLGAAQTYAWAAMHPEMVAAAAPISGSARTANYNKVFLAGLRRAITSDRDFNDGFYTDKPPIRGIKVFAAIYAGWGVLASPSTARRCSARFGAADVEEFIEIFWDAFYVKCDANDLLAQIWTWWHNDLGDHPSFGGDFEAALGAITARTIILNARHRPVLPARRQRLRGGAHPQRRVAPDPRDLGPHGAVQPRGPGLHRPALNELLDG